jgi:hypothetical protein
MIRKPGSVMVKAVADESIVHGEGERRVAIKDYRFRNIAFATRLEWWRGSERIKEEETKNGIQSSRFRMDQRGGQSMTTRAHLVISKYDPVFRWR